MTTNLRSRQRYGATAMILHWLIALTTTAGFYIGWIMTDVSGFTPTKLRYFSWHKWIGVTVFEVAALRLAWRLTHRAPAMPSSMAPLQKLPAEAAHVILYRLMFAIRISIYLYSSAAGMQVAHLGIVPLPTLIGPTPALKDALKTIHIWLNCTLLAELHIARVRSRTHARCAKASVRRS